MSVSYLNLISPENVVFRAYSFWCGILVMKMLLMAVLTSRKRIQKRAIINPEDAKLGKKAQIKVDQDVERVRRAHLNDLENIIPFFVIGFFYVLTNPEASWAINLFRVFAIARILHTFVYAVYVVRQPARALAFGVGLLTTVYMALMTVCHFF